MAVEKKKSVAESIYGALPTANEVRQTSLSLHKEGIESLLKVIAERIASAAADGKRSTSIHLRADTSTLLTNTAVEALDARGYEVDVWRLPRERGVDLEISW